MREGGGELSSASDIVVGRASEILPDGGGSHLRNRPDRPTDRPTVQMIFNTLSNLSNIPQGI